MDLNQLLSFCIGNTPLREDRFLSELFGCSVMIKEEFNSPVGMSSKDRIAFYMIKEAFQQNKLKEGDTLVEASSGNTGIGLANMAKMLGLKCRVFVGKSCSEEKIAVLQNLGVVVEKCENSNGFSDPISTQSCALRFAQKRKQAYFLNQYDNAANFQAHYETTGPEVWEQSEGKITHFIAGIGTGGTLSGTAKYLKERNSAVQMYGVEPLGSVLQDYMKHRILAEIPEEFEKIDGIGRSFIPGNFHSEFIDDVFQVSKKDSIERVLDYKNKTGLLCGLSSGAVLEASVQNLLPIIKPTDKVVMLFPDHGSRYVSKLNDYVKDCETGFDRPIKKAI